jgi:hypothetical protein
MCISSIANKPKIMRVAMNEHDDTIGLGNSKTLAEVWGHSQRFEVAAAARCPRGAANGG